MGSSIRYTWILMMTALLIGCTSAPRYTATKFPATRPSLEPGSYSMVEEGVASYYASEFNGRPTSNGEIYDMNQMTAAHRTLPFNTKVRVTNVATGKSVNVRINDRGPFKADRIIDLSLAAAKELGLIGTGTARVRVEVVELGPTNAVKTP